MKPETYSLIRELEKRIEQCNKEKKRIFDYLQELKEKWIEREISYSDYERIINEKRNGKTIQEWLDYYDWYIKKCEERKGNEKLKSRKKILSSCILLLISFGIVSVLFFSYQESTLLAPSFESRTGDLNLVFEESEEHTWIVGNIGKLESVRISGSIEGEGNVKVYLEDYLILDSNNLEESFIQLSPNGFFNISNETDDENVGEFPEPENETNITLPPVNESNFTDNKTEENFTLPTENEINITLPPINETNETIETAIKDFFEYCEETCSGLDLNKENYVLRIEIIGVAVLNFDKIDYEISTFEEISPEVFPGKIIIEENIQRGKSVTVSDPGGTNISVPIEISESWNIRDANKLKIFSRGENGLVDFDSIDSDNDGIIEEVIIISSGQGDQIYDIIIITKAEHLDSNKTFISDIYEEVKELDGVWSETIPEQHYVRVKFEQNLTSDRDITIYPRVTGGNPKIEVYEINGSEIIASFNNLTDNEYNTVYLTNLSGEQDTFDLRVVGGSLEFDHIVDPTYSTTGFRDIGIAAIDDESFVLAYIDGVSNNLAFSIMSTEGTVLQGPFTVDNGVGLNSRVSVTMINANQFAIGWVRQTLQDDMRAIYDTSGNLIFGPSSGDAVIGAGFYDISVAQMGDRFMYCYVDRAENDADLRMYLNDGAPAGTELNIDIGMAPNQNLANIYDCAAINPTRGVAFWYDGGGGTPVNDATYSIRSETGASLFTDTDIDNNVGAGAQVAVTALNQDRFAMAWYDNDQADQDITIAIRSVTNTPILAPFDIDTNAGTNPRVDIATIGDGTNNDKFVVVWYDQFTSVILAAIYDSSGSQIVSPFVVESSPSTTLPIIEAFGKDSAAGFSLCANTWVVAYTDSTDNAITKSYDSNGAVWDGICPNNLPTIVSVSVIPPVSLLAGTTTDVTFQFTAEDSDGADDFDDTTATASFSKIGETTRSDSLCSVVGSLVKQRTYECTITVEYYDGPGSWTITVSVSDSQGANAQDNSNSITVNLLEDITLSGTPINFGIISPGTQTNAPPITITNNGNYDGTLKITAYDLSGPQQLPAASFYGAESNVAEICGVNGNQLQDSTLIEITTTNLPRGPVGSNSEDIIICLDAPGVLASGSYTATGADMWTISTLASLLAVRRRKKKIKDEKLVKALSLMTEELREKYKLGRNEIIELLGLGGDESIPVSIFKKEIGGLEAISKYMKENLGKSYSEIARELKRDDRTIWTAYNKAKKKYRKIIKVKEGELSVSLEDFKNRKLTILESVVISLKKNGKKISEISRLIERDPRNIQTICSRAVKKIAVSPHSHKNHLQFFLH